MNHTTSVHSATQQAAVIEEYGPADRMHLATVPCPCPADDQVLIRVHAAGVNPIDWRIRKGSLRFILPARFPLVVGYDVAGEVAALGRRVDKTQWRLGDPVFCFLDQMHGGGYAEYAVASAGVLCAKPRNLTDEQAAAVPLAGITALQALRDLGKIAGGMHVLINGASGGVGTFAVQIARSMGAQVTGVCSAANEELVQQLGAGKTIDYRQHDFTQTDERYEIVFDAVGKSSYARCRRILQPAGVYITTLPSPQTVVGRLWTAIASSQSCRMILAQPRGDDLQVLKEMIEQEQVRPVIDRIFPLSEAAAAHEYSETGHVRGKLVLKIGANG